MTTNLSFPNLTSKQQESVIAWLYRLGFTQKRILDIIDMSRTGHIDLFLKRARYSCNNNQERPNKKDCFARRVVALSIIIKRSYTFGKAQKDCEDTFMFNTLWHELGLDKAFNKSYMQALSDAFESLCHPQIPLEDTGYARLVEAITGVSIFSKNTTTFDGDALRGYLYCLTEKTSPFYNATPYNIRELQRGLSHYIQKSYYSNTHWIFWDSNAIIPVIKQQLLSLSNEEQSILSRLFGIDGPSGSNAMIYTEANIAKLLEITPAKVYKRKLTIINKLQNIPQLSDMGALLQIEKHLLYRQNTE